MLFVAWQMHPSLYFLCGEKIQKIPTLPCICSTHSKQPINFAHSIQSHPCPVLLLPSIPLKWNQIGVRSLLPFRCIPFQAFVPHDPSTPLHLHSISHLRLIKQACACIPRALVKCRYILQFHAFAPLPGVHFPIILHSPTGWFFYRHYPYTQKIKKKAKIGGLLMPTLMVCKVKMHFWKKISTSTTIFQ